MKFSVIIPVYNKANVICEAIKSVYAQTMKEYEIIIVDDGSHDGLVEVLESMESPCLRVIHQKNRGVSVARNVGIENARGDFICFLDADDLWKANHLEVLSELIEKYKQAKVFITSHEITTPNGKVFHSSEELGGFEEEFKTEDLIGLLNTTSYSILHTNSMCVKKKLFIEDNIKFEEGITVGEDSDVWYRLGLKNDVIFTKKETTVYRREYSTATRNTFHVQDWIFSLRINDILCDQYVSDKVKKSVIELIDRYKMTSSREYMLANNRKEAKKILGEVKNKRGRRYILTFVFLCLPYAFCEKILRKKY